MLRCCAGGCRCNESREQGHLSVCLRESKTVSIIQEKRRAKQIRPRDKDLPTSERTSSYSKQGKPRNEAAQFFMLLWESCLEVWPRVSLTFSTMLEQLKTFVF